MDDKFDATKPVSAYEKMERSGQHIPRLTYPQSRAPGRAPRRPAINKRFLAVTAALIVIFWVVVMSMLVRQREAVHDGTAAAGCHNEIILLDVWKAQQLVEAIQPQGADIVVTVSRRMWDRTMRQAQISVGMAAYCHVALANKGGVVRVEDESGRELGRVINGKWSSKLFGE
jgi:hypothetical protein